ncbi:hypothetical protein [Novosphingobium sp. 9]|uniref:gp53-like domain-containing protein n=1 Tax=Novosphingobium sp. 9 TaxID=2025349 RepID=UPI0021B61D55|nr:hypothetical protein [Novosphingobium sp. 9]
MAALVLQLTDAGTAAVQAASGTDQTVISDLGLTATAFDFAPTLTALPGEFKRLPITSGVAAAANISHLTVYDTSSDAWTATGIGLFLDDGTLFGVFSSADVVLSKAAVAFGLLMFDVIFAADLASNIAYGNATFLYPPATVTTRGVAMLATQDDVDAAEDDLTIVTPLKLGTRLAALFEPVTAAISALVARKVTGTGLISGGGDLSADRELTVNEASAEDITEGSSADTVVTPRRLGPITMLLAQNGFIRFFGFQMVWGRVTAVQNGSTAVVFVQPFPTACFAAVASGGGAGDTDAKDNRPNVVATTITKTGFSLWNADDNDDSTCFIAVGC